MAPRTAPRRAGVELRRLLALLIGMLVSMGSVACGHANPYTNPSARTPSQATATGRLATLSAADAAPAGRHLFGDYDSDDGRHVVHHSDGDNDDSSAPPDKDNDSDSSGKGRYDSDDGSVAEFGHKAPPSDRHAIVALVKSYYIAAVASNGAKACSLFFAPIAKTYPRDLAEGSERPYLRGLKTCAEVASKLFEQYHAQLSTYAATLTVTNVRLNGASGLVVLGFKTLPSHEVEVMREHGTWKMYTLLDTELP